MEPATPLGLSTATQEQMISPVNPGSLEEDEDLDPPTTRSGAIYRRSIVPRVNPTQPTVPPVGHTVDYSQEFGGPNESQYPVSDTSWPASAHRALTAGSRTSGSEYESARSSSSNGGEDQTLQTSQHGIGPQQGFGTSPTQPPHPGHTSTPTQSQASTVGKDRAASKHIKPPSVQEQPGCPSFVEDAIWTSSNTSRNLSTQPANLSAKDWQEVSDHLEALEVASQEWTRSRSGISTPANSTPVTGSRLLPDTPTMGRQAADTHPGSLERIKKHYLAISLVLEDLFVRVLVHLGRSFFVRCRRTYVLNN